MNINEIKAVVNQAQARVEAGRFVGGVQLSLEDVGDLIEAWDLLYKIADQHQRETPIAASRDCLLCDARELVQDSLRTTHKRAL